MHARGRRVAAHLGDRPGEAQHQVERVNALRDQHAAAVARFGAAALDIVVALRAPQPDHGRAVDDPAELARAQHLASFIPAGRKRCCSITASVTPACAAGLDQLDRAFARDLERLFQQDVLAGRRAFLDQIEMRVRRGEDLDAIDALVGEDRVETAGERKRKLLAERLAPRLARAERGGDLHAVLQVDQALGVRRHRHAEADDRDPVLGHFLGHFVSYCSARIAPRSSASPLRRPMPV